MIYSKWKKVIPIILRSNTFKSEINNVINAEKNGLLIFLFFLYSIFSGFKNIYRIVTIKLYSPMTRALTECICDPFVYIFIYIIKYEEFSKENNVFNIINIICLFIMVFCALVYNEFLIIYCCGFEYNTFIEINKRSLTKKTLEITSMAELTELFGNNSLLE